MHAILKYIAVFLLMIFSIQCTAQQTDVDSAYVSRFQQRNVIEIYPGISSTKFNFRDRGAFKNNYRLVANSSGYVGIYGSYKWVSLKYSWTIPGTYLDKNVKLQYTSLNLNFSLRKWAIRPFYNAYNGLLIPENPRQRDFRPVRDILFKDAGIDVYYFIHTRRFSIKAANSFTEMQVKTAGSLFIKCSPMWQKISWRDPSRDVIIDSTTFKLLSYNPEWFSFIVRTGYTYSISLKKGKWIIAPTVILGAGALKEINTGINHLQLVTDMQASLRAGRNGKTYYYYINARWGNLLTNLFIKNMSQENSNISITFGRRFGNLKNKIFGIL